MKQLKQPGPGPLDEFSKALASGDFNKAKDQLAEVSKQMADGCMSPEQKEQAKNQMENLAKQLEKMSQNSGPAPEEAGESGLDKKAAAEMVKKALANPEDMKKALEEMKNLSPEQKKQLIEMAKAAMKARASARTWALPWARWPRGCHRGPAAGRAGGGGQMAKALSEAEMMQEDMQNLDAALGEAKKQLAELGECLGGDCDSDSDHD